VGQAQEEVNRKKAKAQIEKECKLTKAQQKWTEYA
jgi:hypothetical protein